MKTYETVTIVKPQLSDGEVTAFTDKAKAFIVSAGGEVVSEEKLGRRRFTHDINKSREGFYLYLKFKAKEAFIKDWAENMKLNQNVLRSAVMKTVEPKARPAKTKAAKTSAAA
ncbi:MAG: 30S ribosomal protein S6 [Elusimicrobiota bacterium]|jgi:small subunit ribosomal protein S6|nr:30S ribosomal protein S6 [Elusimicrobiota bacterium]